MFLAFGTFILACGATHTMSIVTLWKPIYRLEGIIKAITALASIATAFFLARLIPVLQSLPSAEELLESNRALAKQIAEKEAVEIKLQRVQGDLEEKVIAQTLHISNANRLLRRTIEDERRASNLLRSREEEFRLCCDAARLGTWRWTIGSGECVGDLQMKMLYGLHPDISLDRTDQYFAVIHAEDRKKVQDALEEAVRGGQPYNTEFRVVHPDGSNHWIAGRGSVQRDRGEPVSMMGINLDIDAQKSAEIGCQESERMFATLADSIPQLAWMADPEGAIFWYNARWYEYTGTTLEQMRGWGWQSVHDPQELPGVMEKWQACLASGRDFEMDFPLRGNDGKFTWFLTRVIAIRNAQGKILRWFGTNTDVTGIHDALLESENQFQQLADTMPQLVSIIGPDGTVEWLNHCWYSYTGTTLDKAESAIHPDDREIAQQTWVESLTGESSYEREYRLRRHEGTYRWFLGRARPVRDASGEIVRWFVTCTDIDDRKQAEAAILKVNTGLTACNERLQLETQRSEEANAAKSSFLATMSHEIRTPMNAILGMSDLLWDSKLDEEQRQYVEVFRRAGQTLLALINNILDLSKIEAGHFELESVPFDFEDLVDSSLELIRPKASAKGVALMSRITPDVHTSLLGDPTRLQQILVNLLGNAVKFTEAGEVLLTIGVGNSGKPGCLEIAVSDTGIGVPPEKLETIFQDFAQADNSTTRRYGGTGLGLGICKRLIQCMGGNLAVESAVGRGSTFRFTINLEPVVDIGPAVHLQLPGLHGQRILIIDNNATNRLILRETLSSWGMESLECSSAKDAIRAMTEANQDGGHFAMVVLDVQMPGVDGFAAIPMLRHMEPEIPIVMLTSDDRPGDPARRRKAGVSGFAVKPVKRGDLLRLICTALRESLESTLQPSAPSSKLSEDDVTLGPLRILIAEDSPDNRMLFQAYLKQTPHALTFAEDGELAVDQFLANPYDLILMDMQMPGMDGLAATRAIRTIERTKGRQPTPIVAVTANAMTQDLADSHCAGCDAHLSKPISKEKLLSAIDQYRRASAASNSAR
jgi:PAS domain S-box-containing protein